MIFNSIPFILFFPFILIIYYIVPQKYRTLWLLIVSYFFYFTQSTAFVSFLLLSTISTYLAGILLYRTDSVKLKNLIIAVTFLINVGLIVVVKYTDFILELAGSDVRYNFFLPIGISFYTLQALSYVMDAYRRRITPVCNFMLYALYVSFFPCLLSGPICRSTNLIPELRKKKTFSLENLKCGMQKMLWGYFLKLVIAGRLVILVDTVYGDIPSYSGASLLLAAISFLFMLYCDFEGYSCIAIGASKILGINLPENFRQPFYSTSIGELWHRWHISLSTWLREYLYFPLGGSRHGNLRKYLNYLIVFFVSGLWHGANFTFFIWGLMNGIFLIGGRLLINIRNDLATRCGLSKLPKLRTFLQRVGVYCLYGFSMIFFDSKNVSDALNVITGIFTRFSVSKVLSGELFTLGIGTYGLLLCLVLAVFVLYIDGICYRNDWDISDLLKRTKTPLRWSLYILIMIGIVFSANLTGTEFIYSKM